MPYSETKMQQAVLALLGACEVGDGRVWKRYDFALMEALFERGLITDPHGRQASVSLTEAGLREAKALAARHFGE